jgi:hypothetical protein
MKNQEYKKPWQKLFFEIISKLLVFLFFYLAQGVNDISFAYIFSKNNQTMMRI